MKLIVIRSFSSMIAMYMAWMGLQLLPIGLHSVLQNLNPIFTLILGYVVLKESLNNLELVNLLCCFTGVILILVFKNKGSTES
jgi:drug/metabolite transporter (DMT)-like permease